MPGPAAAGLSGRIAAGRIPRGKCEDHAKLSQRHCRIYTGIPTLVADGIYGNATANAVRTFQRLFGLTVDGIIGRITWNRIVTVYNSL